MKCKDNIIRIRYESNLGSDIYCYVTIKNTRVTESNKTQIQKLICDYKKNNGIQLTHSDLHCIVNKLIDLGYDARMMDIDIFT